MASAPETKSLTRRSDCQRKHHLSSETIQRANLGELKKQKNQREAIRYASQQVQGDICKASALNVLSALDRSSA